MAQVINTNVQSLTAQRNLNSSQSALSNALQRLSSGLRVNSAKDDAAGLAVAERMNAQYRGMNVAIRNANDGISYAQTAEGGLQEIGNAIQRMREIAVQGANGTYGTADLKLLQREYAALSKEVTRIVQATKFNGIGVLAASTSTTFQIGADNVSSNQIVLDAVSVDLAGLSLGNVSTASGAQTALDNLTSALDTINGYRADFGAIQNRFESTIASLRISAENQAAARSRIVDADFAAETASLTRAQILQQAGVAMLAQANSLPQNVLSLLR